MVDCYTESTSQKDNEKWSRKRGSQSIEDYHGEAIRANVKLHEYDWMMTYDWNVIGVSKNSEEGRVPSTLKMSKSCTEKDSKKAGEIPDI